MLNILEMLVLLNGHRIAEQKLWIRLTKRRLSLKRVGRDVDAHDAAVEHNGVGRDIAGKKKIINAVIRQENKLYFCLLVHFFKPLGDTWSQSYEHIGQIISLKSIKLNLSYFFHSIYINRMSFDE